MAKIVYQQSVSKRQSLKHIGISHSAVELHGINKLESKQDMIKNTYDLTLCFLASIKFMLFVYV